MALTTKAELRNYYLRKRNALSSDVRSRWSAAIARRIVAHPSWRSAGTVLIYASFGSEVETRALLEKALEGKKRLVLPVGDRSHQSVAVAELRTIDDLAQGPFKGIAEPKADGRMLISPSEVELALIPGIAFDARGIRLGMGGGFYDRLLPTMTEGFFVALAFSAQLHAEALPREKHDARMHAIVTEEEWKDVR